MRDDDTEVATTETAMQEEFDTINRVVMNIFFRIQVCLGVFEKIPT